MAAKKTKTDSDSAPQIDPNDSITRDELAKLIGVKSSSIGGLVYKGIAVKAGRNRYARQASVRNYCESLRTNQVGRPSTNTELNAEKLRLVRAQVEKQELANAKTRGALLDSDTVANEWAKILVDLRAGILAIPERVASTCGLGRIETIALDTEIRLALEVIADDH